MSMDVAPESHLSTYQTACFAAAGTSILGMVSVSILQPPLGFAGPPLVLVGMRLRAPPVCRRRKADRPWPLIKVQIETLTKATHVFSPREFFQADEKAE